MKKIINVFTFLFLSMNFLSAQPAFFMCDTECRTFPLGDCNSGHTDADNIEWPCNIDINVPGVTPSEMGPDDLELMTGVVDLLDARPQLINYDTASMAVVMTYEDVVFNVPGAGYKILRTWTVLEWFGGTVATYDQFIKNINPNAVNCDVMVCNNGLQVSLSGSNPPSVELWASDILEGDYTLCDPETFIIDVMDANNQVVYSGVGSVVVNEEGTFTVQVTNPSNQNSCWSQVTFEDRQAPCQTPFTSDNIEWPNDVTIDLPNVSAQLLSPQRLVNAGVDAADSEPNLINYTCDLVAMVYDDTVIASPDGSYKILRTWTLIDWFTGNVFTQIQIIKNTSPQSSNCGALACNSLINVAMAYSPANPVPMATIYVNDLLEGNYPNCDLMTFTIEIDDTDGNPVTNAAGSVTLLQTGLFNYKVTDPATGNSCWGQLNVENRLSGCAVPFYVCDTECRTTPLGDCDSGHTDSDNVEWPCDIVVDLPGVEPQMLTVGNMSGHQGIDQLDIQPLIVDYACNFIAWTYEDEVFDLGADGFEINRKWTIVDWLTGNAFEYEQLIKNLAPGLVPSSCGSLACNTGISASLPDNNGSIDLYVSDLLEGGYPNCDLTTFGITVTDQLGSIISTTIGDVRMDQPGTFTYQITDPSTLNSCWGTLVLSDVVFLLSGTEDLSILSGVEVYPNPARDIVNFDFENLDLKGDVHISVLDRAGRVLLSGKNMNQLNTSKLSSGLYIYQIRNEDAIHHGKLSILK